MISIYFPEEPNIQEKTAVRSFWESLRLVFIMNLLRCNQVVREMAEITPNHSSFSYVMRNEFFYQHAKTNRVRGNCGKKRSRTP